MQYFQKSLERAQTAFNCYQRENGAQISNIAFGAAGNLSKGSSNRLKRMTGKRGDLAIDIGRRKLFLKMYETTVFGWAKIPNWEGINSILLDCCQERYWNDETNYYNLSFHDQTPLVNKLTAIIYFIDRYGSSTDKRILIPKFTI